MVISHPRATRGWRGTGDEVVNHLVDRRRKICAAQKLDGSIERIGSLHLDKTSRPGLFRQ